MSRTRKAIALALGAGILGATGALAAPAPPTTGNSSTFFLRQEGCGTTDEAGRLEPKAGTDGSTGCGTIGGIPLDEAIHALGAATPDDYATVGKGLPIKLDVARKVTGQLAASSWIGLGVGAGQVTFDVAMTAKTASGKSIDFGETTASGVISPGTDVATAEFALPVPAAAAKEKITSIVLSVVQRGANFGFSSKQLDGDSYVVLPTKK